MEVQQFFLALSLSVLLYQQPANGEVTVAANPPSDLTAVQSGPNSVSVSWTAPAPGGATRIGYRIFIDTDDSERSVDVGASATSHTQADLELADAYYISIVTLSAILSSEVLGPETVTIDEPMMPDVITTVLSSTSIAVTFIQLNYLMAERYDIEYTRVTGAGQALCGSVRHAGNEIDVQSPYTITDLEEFSSYTISVTAHFFSSTVTISAEQVEETLQAPPTGSPLSLTVIPPIQITTVTVEWRQVTCIDRNGVIDNYIVQYGPEGDEVMENATVSTRFTASGLTPFAEYTFKVAAENSAGIGPFTLPLIVTTSYVHVFIATLPPSDLTAVQSGPNNVDVSWTAPAPGGRTRTGYHIFFETEGSENSVDVGSDATSHTLTDLEIGETYNISIIALSAILPSEIVGPVTVTIEEPMMPHVLTRVLSSTSIAVTFFQLNYLMAERYDIEYTRVTGAGQILCGSVRDAGNETDVQSPYIITDLEEFSNYTIAVTAHYFNSRQQISTEQVAETLQAPPTGSPFNSMVIPPIQTTSITIQWHRVTCIERNGVIRNYIVRYGQEGGVMENATVPGQFRRFTASGLTPFTKYTFEVAAENSAGIGPFTLPLIVTITNVHIFIATLPRHPSDLTAVQSGPNSVDVSWTAPAPGGPTRIGYHIVFETDDSEDSVDVEASATSHTLTDLEIGETYIILIVALSAILPSEVFGPEMVTIEEPMMPHVLTRVLSSTSIAVDFIQLSGLMAEKYDIEYARVTGAGQALCGSVGDAGYATDVQSPYIITDFGEFSNYTIAVTAHYFNSRQQISTEQVAETLQAPPTDSPLNLMVMPPIESNSVSIGWGRVTCIDRNGVLENYIVQYGPEGGEVENAIMSGQIRSFTASGLTPFTNYTFEVAAENSAGRGPFTLPFIVTTTMEEASP